MSRQGRTQLVLGILLIALGAWFLADRSLPAFHDLVTRYMQWPFSLITIGVGLLVLGLILGAPGMAVPAAVVAGIGGIFYYFDRIGNWSDWYMWLLVPGFVGVGSVLAGLLGEHTRHNISRGLNLMVISAVLFLVFSSLLGGWQQLGNYGPAILIILLGLWVLGNGLFRTWKQNRIFNRPEKGQEDDHA
jgi:hypothetical protein